MQIPQDPMMTDKCQVCSRYEKNLIRSLWVGGILGFFRGKRLKFFTLAIIVHWNVCEQHGT